MNIDSPSSETLHHHARPMGGRDPRQAHRAATPLELLFDLTFVIAFGVGASEYAHALAEGHFSTALMGFAFAGFAICWAWINFSWFASAYDTDDWIFRLVTMVQMAGVLVLAMGLAPMFASIERGEHLDNSVMVLGYVIMRVALLFQWLRAAKQDSARRTACLTYATAISVSQLGWIGQIFLDMPIAASFILTFVLILIELAGPVLAERKSGGTPWHAHHIVERHGLFAIIALGEGVVGTVATLSAAVRKQGWTVDAALVCIAGTGLTFGMWWIYYILPSARVLEKHRNRSFVWGYGHIIVVTAIVATGAGLHVAADFIAHTSHISQLATVLSVVVPVGIYLVSIYALYYWLVRCFDPFHIWLLIGTGLVIALVIGAAVWGVPMAVCLVMLVGAPAVTVVGYEVRGHQHQLLALGDQEGRAES